MMTLATKPTAIISPGQLWHLSRQDFSQYLLTCDNIFAEFLRVYYIFSTTYRQLQDWAQLREVEMKWARSTFHVNYSV
jgi:hypothetical protein